jgi:hypothetical protein
VPRREATPAQVGNFLSQLESDLSQGILVWQALDLDQVFDRAETIGAQFTERLNIRSFDILQVSIALELGCDTFHTFDHDQIRSAPQTDCERIVSRPEPTRSGLAGPIRCS